MSIQLSKEATEAFELLQNTNQNLFVTGYAGTGKSTFLKYFLERTSKNYAVLAPTGVAAVNIGGETIHSFFKFGISIQPSEAKDYGRKAKNKIERSLYQNLELLVIDEISMVRSDLMDCIDRFLKAVRDNNGPFGGVQMLFLGDLFQLPPIVSREQKEYFDFHYRGSPYFFSASCMKEFDLKMIEFTHIYRQAGDHEFIDILNSIRDGKITPKQLVALNSNVCKRLEGNYIKLCSTNAIADKINQEEIRRNTNPYRNFCHQMDGEFKTKDAPVPETLTLKEGMQVMFQNNDKEGRWINGTMGEVIEMDSQSVRIKLETGTIENVYPYTWKINKSTLNSDMHFDNEEVGAFTQLPLRPAYAITIHKSQGKTFAKCKIDTGKGLFAHGQAYVALSRCTCLEGISLAAPIFEKDIIFDKHVLDFYNLKNTLL